MRVNLALVISFYKYNLIIEQKLSLLQKYIRLSFYLFLKYISCRSSLNFSYKLIFFSVLYNNILFDTIYLRNIFALNFFN
jgi:hypothetical protein